MIHSNLPLTVNFRLMILAINARFLDSVHDAAIWATNQIRELLQNNYTGGDHSSWLIGSINTNCIEQYILKKYIHSVFSVPLYTI